MHLRRLIPLGVTAAAAALTLLGQTAASAMIIGDPTSDHLAGYQLVGNHGDRFRDARAQVHVPTETSAVTADSLVAGFTSADSINGGFETGIGLVYDDPAAAPDCTATQWVVEAGTGNVGATPMPLPTSDLAPLLRFGHDICVNGGGSRYLETFYNKDSRYVHFREGPSVSNNDQVGTAAFPNGQYIGYHNFLTVGFGVDTTNGTVAGNVTSGTVTRQTGVKVTQYNGRSRQISTLNVEQWLGTVTGGAPSVLNPRTLIPGPLTAGSAFTVSAP